MDIKDLCELNCVHRDKCNKRFAEMLKAVEDSVVWVVAECGRHFRISDTLLPKTDR